MVGTVALSFTGWKSPLGGLLAATLLMIAPAMGEEMRFLHRPNDASIDLPISLMRVIRNGDGTYSAPTVENPSIIATSRRFGRGFEQVPEYDAVIFSHVRFITQLIQPSYIAAVTPTGTLLFDERVRYLQSGSAAPTIQEISQINCAGYDKKSDRLIVVGGAVVARPFGEVGTYFTRLPIALTTNTGCVIHNGGLYYRTGTFPATLDSGATTTIGTFAGNAPSLLGAQTVGFGLALSSAVGVPQQQWLEIANLRGEGITTITSLPQAVNESNLYAKSVISADSPVAALVNSKNASTALTSIIRRIDLRNGTVDSVVEMEGRVIPVSIGQ
jgi:hypothetical protein